MNIDFDAINTQIAGEFRRTVERALVCAVEQIEGRVPSNDEVKRHGEVLISPDGRKMFTWKGVPIVGIPRDPMVIKDGKVSFQLATSFKDGE